MILDARLPLFVLFAFCFNCANSVGATGDVASAISLLEAGVPRRPADFSAKRVDRLADQARQIEIWASTIALYPPVGRTEAAADDVLRRCRELLEAKAAIDRQIEETLPRRHELVSLTEDAPRREALRQYLRTTSQLIDASGRVRFLLSDLLRRALFQIEPFPKKEAELFELLTSHRSSIGAAITANLLVDPDPKSGGRAAPLDTKRRVLRLIHASREADLLPMLATFVRQASTPADLKIAAAEIIVRLGLWQDPRPGQDANLPKPAITARDLYDVAADTAGLRDSTLALRTSLLTSLRERAEKGVQGEAFRVSGYEVREGDWLLMRNPSPYNMFTDLAPGLFTHVGVVAAETGSDGKRRFVIVEMPEREAEIPATNVEVYLQRTLHYFFMRHDDPEVGRRMGQIAAQTIGAPTQFDLAFRTERVADYKGKPLQEQVLNTYCAGFLLLCAQETSLPREAFFPIEERPAGGKLDANLAKLGLSVGDRFVSPTAALFSPHMKIIGRREPMYEPTREVKEAVYDYFAFCMIQKTLTPSPDAYQTLREKLASLSKTNPWLARALAKANKVSEHMDLETAAKAAAVVEVLDEIADSNADEFTKTYAAFFSPPKAQLTARGVPAKEVEEIERRRKVHAGLLARWNSGGLSPRELRSALVDYYIGQGKKSLDQRFFN